MEYDNKPSDLATFSFKIDDIQGFITFKETIFTWNILGLAFWFRTIGIVWLCLLSKFSLKHL